jgi:hypothetical protein
VGGAPRRRSPRATNPAMRRPDLVAARSGACEEGRRRRSDRRQSGGLSRLRGLTGVGGVPRKRSRRATDPALRRPDPVPARPGACKARRRRRPSRRQSGGRAGALAARMQTAAGPGLGGVLWCRLVPRWLRALAAVELSCRAHRRVGGANGCEAAAVARGGEEEARCDDGTAMTANF